MNEHLIPTGHGGAEPPPMAEMAQERLVAELADAWQRERPVRDPRDVYIAECRVLGILDDATAFAYGRAWAQVPGGVHRIEVYASCEREYQRLLTERPGATIPDDWTSAWMLQQRDLEVAGSAEWWAYDRLRRRYRDLRAVGGEPGTGAWIRKLHP